MINPFNTKKKQKKKKPFSSTGLGIAVNTAIGIPQAIKKVNKDVKTGVFSLLKKTFPGVPKAIQGIRSGDWSEYRTWLTEEGQLSSKNLKDPRKLATSTIGMIDPASGVTKKVIKETLEEFFVKETKPKVIKTVLEELGHPQSSLDDMASRLAKSKTPEQVKSVLNPAPLEALTQAVRSAKPLRGEIETLQSAERAKRFAIASKSQANVGGEQGYFAGLSKLKGVLLEKSPQFTPARNMIPKEGIDTLYTAIQKNPVLNFGEQLSAQSGLKKLLDGNVPVPSELKVLEEVFGSDVVRAIYDRRPPLQKVWDVAKDVLADLPRALQTTIDMSGTLRQGVVLGLRNPVKFTKAFGKSFKSMIDNNYFEKSLDEMKLTPEYRVATDAGLRLSDPRKLFGHKEEYFLSNLAEKLPFMGKLVKATNRAYVGLLNNLRFSVFNDLATSFGKTGQASEKNLKSLADFINTATGSGGLGKLEKNAELLSKVFFAPRFIMSRVQFMNPVWYAKQPKPVRMEALKTFGTFAGTVSTLITLAELSGNDVETNWKSSNFGKMKVGNTYYDLTFGFGQYIRLMAQVASGEKKTQSGKIEKFGGDKPYSETTGGAIMRVARGKLAPLPSTVTDLAFGKDVVGNKVTLGSELLDQVTPLYIQDLTEAIKDKGVEALLTTGLPAFFGVSTQTQLKKQNTKNPFNI